MSIATFFFRATVFFLCLTVAGCGRKNPPSASTTSPCSTAVVAETLKVLAYNVENLFDMVHDGTEYEEYVPQQCGWTEEMMETKVRNIASVIAAVCADIAILCEIENARALRRLIETLRHYRCPYDYWAIDTAIRETAVRPAIVARYPLLDVKTITPSSKNSWVGREMLEADCCIGRVRLKIFALHWPSKSKPESFRVANARTLMERIVGLPPSTDYIIAGDFNADYNECETMRLSPTDDTRGVSSINHILKTVRSAVGAEPLYVHAEDLPRLGHPWHFNPWLELPASLRCSAVYQGRAQTPDHIVLSAALFDSAGISYVDSSFGVFTWEGKLLSDGVPFRWQVKFRGRKRYHLGKGYSDHLPVVATLRLGEYVRPERPSGRREEAAPEVLRVHESTVLGWIPCSRTMRVTAKTLEQGEDVVRIEGEAPSATLRALRRVLTISPRASHLILPVCGNGKMGVRLRSRNGQWWYYAAPDFSPKRAIRYRSLSAPSWQKLRLSLAPMGSCREIEMEIRIGKGEAYRLLIGTPKVQ